MEMLQIMLANSRTRRFSLICICLLLCTVACVLRFVGCFTFPFFGDEAFTLQSSRNFHEFWRTWNSEALRNTRLTPLFAMNSLLLDYFDDSVTAIRVIPFAAGVLFFPIFMWLLAKRFGVTVMTISLTIMAFNPTHIYFSQYARYYSFVFLIANLGLYTFFVSFERRSRQLFVLSQFLSLLAFLSHRAAGTLVVAEVAYLIALALLSWMDGRTLIPRRDTFSLTVLVVFGAACVTVFALSIATLSKWQVISIFQANYDTWSFLGGIMLRIGIPLMAFCGIASVYFVFRRDRTGMFFSLALFCPIVVGIFLASMGMEVSPVYVAFVIFPASFLAAYFLAELLKITTSYQGKGRIQGYACALLLASTTALISSNSAEFVSYYLDGNRPDIPNAMAWIESARSGEGGIVIIESIAHAVHFCRHEGIAFEQLPLKTSLDSVIRSVENGNVVIMSYLWWAKMPSSEFVRLADVPHWLILSTERDGLTPRVPERVAVREDWAIREIILEAVPSQVLADAYQLETRIGKTRLDHRHNYLLIYGPKQVPPR